MIVDLIELNAQTGDSLEIRLCGGNEEENAERLKAFFGDE